MVNTGTCCPGCAAVSLPNAVACLRCGLFFPSTYGLTDEGESPGILAASGGVHGPRSNPYQAPISAALAPRPGWIYLADRPRRLIAWVIDSVFVFGAGLAGLLLDGAGAFGLALYFAALIFNLVLLGRRGQTLGKVVIGIKVVDRRGEKPSWFLLVFVRTLPFSVAPVQFSLLGYLDVVHIFRDERQCLHDAAAGTLVLRTS